MHPLDDYDDGPVWRPRSPRLVHGKVDQGPCWTYWRLSYRRRFIRLCWTVPLGLTLLALFQVSGLIRYEVQLVGLPWEDRWGWYFIGACAAFAPLDIAYNYVRWRREARRPAR